MADSFKQDCERIQRLLVSVKTDLTKRDQKKAQNLPVAMIEGEIRGQITNLGNLQQTQKERELDLFQNILLQQEKNQAANNLTQREVEKRRLQYTEFVNQKNDLKNRFQESIQSAKEKLFADGNQNKTQATRFQDNYDAQNMSNKDIYKAQKDLQSQQDEQLDRVNEKLTTIKYTGQAMNENIKQQNKMLDQVNADVDQTTKEMMKTNSKLKKFIATSSNTWLLLIILLEFITLILLIVYL